MGPGRCAWSVWGTSAVVLTVDELELPAAVRAVRAVLDEYDRSCNRFRPDSEISQMNTGHRRQVSPSFVRACRTALRAAVLTDGALDPTVGSSLVAAGYDRDFAALQAGGTVRFVRAHGHRHVRLNEKRGTVDLPPGVKLDFGATAKALAADNAADAAVLVAAGGVLVSLGGDMALRGPTPAGGWAVAIADDSGAEASAGAQTVALHDGGLATSSTTVRRWRRGQRTLHHILDPTTGAPVESGWRTVSVAAASCVDANIAATTAIIRGEQAAGWLEERGLPARLVGDSGDVVFVGAWPRQDGPRQGVS